MRRDGVPRGARAELPRPCSPQGQGRTEATARGECRADCPNGRHKMVAGGMGWVVNSVQLEVEWHESWTVGQPIVVDELAGFLVR